MGRFKYTDFKSVAMNFLLISTFVSTLMGVTAGTIHAEERKKSDLEKSIPIPEKKADLKTQRRTRITEEQAVNQLKYMMVKGWARMEKELVTTGGFSPFGMVLSPKGEFKALIVDAGDKDKDVLAVQKLSGVVTMLKDIAKTRSMWAVGLMYIVKKDNEDGTVTQRIMVMTEHIAGWGRHWSYPFKVVNGEVKLGAPKEEAVKPVYFTKSK